MILNAYRRSAVTILTILVCVLLSLTVYIIVEAKRDHVAVCIAQNQRHDRTVSFLRTYVQTYERTHHLKPRQLKTVAGEVQAQLTLIQDLQPHQHC